MSSSVSSGSVSSAGSIGSVPSGYMTTYAGVPNCPCSQCPEGGEPSTVTFSGGVNTFTGKVVTNSLGMSSNGFGVPFGTALYYDNMAGGVSSGFGSNWVPRNFEGLRIGLSGSVFYSRGADDVVQFLQGGTPGSYNASYFVRDVLSRDTSTNDFTLASPSGTRKFFDSTGKPTRIANAGGEEAAFGYQSGQLKTVSMVRGAESWEYEFVWDGALVDHILYKVNGRQVLKTVYGYVSGRLETVKVYENSTTGTGEPDWGTVPVEAARYSYHTSGLLRHVVPPAQYRQMVANGLDPDSASEANLNAYAETEYEYGVGNRVSKVYTHGRSCEYGFTYTGGMLPGNVYNTWQVKTELTRPGNVVETFYLNAAGQVILKRIQKKNSGGAVTKTWYPIFQKFQGDGGARIVQSAKDSTIDPDSFSEGKGSLVDLWTDKGLVTEYIYNAQGLLWYTQELEGTEGAPARVRELTYVDRTVTGLGTIQKLATEKAFRNDNGTGAVTTSYGYQWHSGTMQPSKVTKTLPVVLTSENGTGVATVTEEDYDADGYLTATRDGVGTVTTYQYDKAKGGMTQKVEDAGVGRLNLQTDYQLDDRGRTTRVLGPQHSIDIAGVNTAIRSAQWTYYKDREGETWTINGYQKVTGSTDHCVAAVLVSRRNMAGTRPGDKSGWRLDEEVAVKYTGSSLPSSTTSFDTLFPRATWESWRVSWIDKADRLKEEWTYWNVPASGFGTVDVDYGAKKFGYDEAGRLNKTTCAGGTTDFTEFNAMGWVKTEQIGVDDGPYAITRCNNYDGNGNLTKVTLPVSESDEDDRVIEYGYDWRNRRTSETTKVEKDPSEGTGEWTLIKIWAYENRGLVTSETSYHTEVSTANRTGYRAMSYDAVGRLYRTSIYAVNPSNGNISLPQTSNLYYDANDRVTKNAPSGSSLFTATEYDAVGRASKVYQAYLPSSSSSSSSSSSRSSLSSGSSGYPAVSWVANAIVMEQVENAYDEAGNVLLTVTRQRYDDATGVGPLKTATLQPKARVSYAASYPNALGWVQATANYGTNDGAWSGRSPTIPPRSGLMSQPEIVSYAYDDLGRVIVQTDPAGINTCQTWDKAGRLVKVVENCSGTSSSSSSSSSSGGAFPLVPASRTTEYQYTSDGWLRKLISHNLVTGQQVTEWIYGVNTDNGSELSSKRLVYQKLFPGATEPVTYSYNRQQQVIGMEDQLGTEHGYGYDKLGRLVADMVETFGTGVDEAVGRLEAGYNNRGLVIRASSYDTAGTSVVNEIAWDYNGFNQPTAEYQEHGGAVNKSTSLKVGYAYDGGVYNTVRPLSIKYPHAGSASATTIGLDYAGAQANALSRPEGIKEGASTVSSWRYVGLSMIVSQKYNAASDAELSYGNSADGYSGYDRFGRIVGTQWKAGSTVLVQSKYGRNAVGGISWRKDEKAHADSVTTQDTHYWYDGLWQVKRADRGALTPSGGPPYTGITNLQQQENFGYDETGNWMTYQSMSPALVQNRSHNKGNQITSITEPTGVTQPAYDPAGNMTTFPAPSSWTTGYTGKWDAWNRLVELKQGSTVVGSYAYDAQTRRIQKTTASETRDYYYDKQWRTIEERVGGTMQSDYVWSPFDRWNLIRRRRSVSGSLDETLFVLRDYLDPVALLNASGSVVERYGYDAFGVVQMMNASFATITSSAYTWTFLFHAEFIDSESGLYNYGFRYYHPTLGRWLSRDPIGEEGGINLFAMAENNPVNWVDQTGLFPNHPKLDSGNPSLGGSGTPSDPYYDNRSAEQKLRDYLASPAHPDNDPSHLGEMPNDPYPSCLSEGWFRHCYNSCILQHQTGVGMITQVIAQAHGHDLPFDPHRQYTDVEGNEAGIQAANNNGKDKSCKDLCRSAYDQAVKDACCAPPNIKNRKDGKPTQGSYAPK